MNHLIRAISVGSAFAVVSVLGGCSATDSAPQESVGEAQQDLSVSVCPASVPAVLTPPATESLKSKVSAVGVQIYICNAKPATPTTAETYAWTFLAPQANLFNDEGRLIGTHFIGPTWQGNDGSSVVGAKLQGATVDATAVPWLLLQAKSHAADEGRFSDVSYVQRLSTVGGNAPTDACDATHNLGVVVQVPYSADYFFYETKTHGKVKQCGGA
jgi:Protein of unknown function (DUF3455)